MSLESDNPESYYGIFIGILNEAGSWPPLDSHIYRWRLQDTIIKGLRPEHQALLQTRQLAILGMQSIQDGGFNLKSILEYWDWPMSRSLSNRASRPLTECERQLADLLRPPKLAPSYWFQLHVGLPKYDTPFQRGNHTSPTNNPSPGDREMNKPSELRPGQRIELVAMIDDPYPVEPGARGTVHRVDVRGTGANAFLQVDVDWDNGRLLMLAVPPDQYRVIED